MYYVVVEHEIHEFSYNDDAEKFYDNAKAEWRDPFGTQDLSVARLVQEGNIAEDYLRGVM